LKGLILAGGTGSRLYPTTMSVNKHLLPIYDKPMIYYPLAKLMLLGISEIAIICRSEDMPAFKATLNRVMKLGVKLHFLAQESPNGLPEAFIIAEDFIGDEEVVLILGDNILYGNQLHEEIRRELDKGFSANAFAYRVSTPESFGVVEFDESETVRSIEEKPENPKSNYALVGLYKFDSRVASFAKLLSPSERGETEIVDLMQCYLRTGDLKVKVLGRGNTWLDTGTPENLLNASLFVETIESRQGYNIACLEEICLRLGYASKQEVLATISQPCKTKYDQYILDILNGI
jgi:glucose-1-phosphate thymidylyltransferase